MARQGRRIGLARRRFAPQRLKISLRMLFVLSPAKTLDFTPAPPSLPATKPDMTGDTRKLAPATRGLKAADLRRLMDISEPLADLNVARFKAFQPKGTEADVQAALA